LSWWRFFLENRMAAFTAFEPKWIPTGGIISPRTVQVYPAQQAAWRTGDLLINVTTGTVTTPTGGTATSFTNATGANTPGPSLGTAPVPFNVTSSSYSATQGAVTVTASASASAPAQSLWCIVTYTITATTESQNSAPFLINTVAGVLPIVNVTATGAPAGATTYALYAGFLPLSYYRQSAVTALGSTTTTAYPLTNSSGVNKAAAGVSTGIIGMADSDSDAYFAGILGATAGGSQNTGKRSLFGATQSFGPGWTNDAFALPVTKLGPGLIELSLVQGFYPSLIFASTGFNIDATTGYFVADTTQTAAGTIQDIAFSPGQGNVGDTGARVRVQLNSSAVV
jgi:hypothetical protein